MEKKIAVVVKQKQHEIGFRFYAGERKRRDRLCVCVCRKGFVVALMLVLQSRTETGQIYCDK